MREKLIELIDQVLRCLPWGEISSHTAEDIADRLIDNGVTIQRWIPVKDKQKPKDGEKVFAYYADKVYRVTKYDSYDGFPLVLTNGFEWARVTHWMPLPEAPKGE